MVNSCASNAGVADSTPGQGNKIPQAALYGQNLKETESFFFFKRVDAMFS